ncbi:cell division protein DamX [Alteromonas sp. ASW11-19]|uniref:Cell division protein DamX n=1 Tax=Alteromonas salexigens TaxID=2982530 RepID=A0ABT2VJD6_9ALTE|nr:cell division protein DamX [Alteromonas salexigens]MCU7553317.1 cell division protein DamX [Alteromonas salexigens]
MHSELHDRLEYLVNYSSQLIFVSGDSISQQQRTLEAFVFQQHEDTEIAFVSADEAMDITDYRRQLCRQLLGQVVGSYVRPLNELLASLNQHEGPILVTITQAQFIPDSLLQELWDLVLQSRFGGNKQHLNVLLFGETLWAEKAKQWLPAKNTDTPLLISSQSVHSDPVDSDLDKLLARQREGYQQHMAARYGKSGSPGSATLRSTWFWVAVSCLFVSVFAGLIAWQYGKDISTLFAPLESAAPPASTDSVVPGSAFSSLANEPRNTVAEPALPQIIPASEPVTETAATDSGTGNDGELVTDWQQAVAALPAPAVQDAPATPDAQQDVLASQPQTVPTDASTEPVTPQNDSPVREKPAVDTLTAKASSAATKADTEAAPAETVAQTTTSDNALLVSKLRSDDFLLQLAGLQDRQLLNDFVTDNQLGKLTHVYQTRRYGGDWYVLVFHQPFGSLAEAKGALSALPQYPGRGEAFVKRADQVLSEIRLTQQ